MPRVAIIDYGLGNLFSIRMSCEAVGAEAFTTADAKEILAADAVILPGVGAFGDAMGALGNLGKTLRQVADSGRPLMGICLGMQLLMSSSEEFGHHAGLSIIPGHVRKLKGRKVPHVGWAKTGDQSMYFNHSFVCEPRDRKHVVAVAAHEGETFCAAIRAGNVTGYQFHPEKSGSQGLAIYRNLFTH